MKYKENGKNYYNREDITEGVWEEYMKPQKT